MSIKKLKVLVLILVFAFGINSTGAAYWVWSPEQGKFINPQSSIEDSADEQFKYSLGFYKEKNYKRAQNEFEDLIKQFPSSVLAAESLFFLGQIQEENANFFKAFKNYQKIIEDYPQSERVDEVVEKQFNIGMLYVGGKKEKFLGMRVVPSITKAIEVFSKIVETSPYSAYGDQAQYRLAQAYRENKEIGKAGEAYQALIDNYPDSVLVDDARFEMAESVFLRNSSPDRDFRSLEKASENFDEFIKQYPDSPVVDKAIKLKNVIKQKAAEKNFKIGEFYEKDNYLESAIIYYEDVVRLYPDTEWGRQAKSKINQLRKPGEFLEQRSQQLEAKRRDLQARKEAIEIRDGFDSSQLKGEKDKIKSLQKTLDKEESSFDKNKKQSLKLRRNALERDKKEIGERQKSLNKKKKLLKKNPSDSLQKALDRWQDSLDAEKYSLSRRESDLIRLEEQFGVRTDRFRLLEKMPFMGGKELELQAIMRYKEKDLEKLNEKLQKLKSEKEELYSEKQNLKVRLASVGPWGLEVLEQDEPVVKDVLSQNPQISTLKQKLDLEEETLSQLKSQYKEIQESFSKFGSSILGKVGQIAKAPISLAKYPAEIVGGTITKINPFDGNSSQTERETFLSLVNQRQKTEQRIAKAKDVIQTIQTSFEKELVADVALAEAEEENEKVIDSVEFENKEPISLTAEMKDMTLEQRRERIALKKKIKQVEKDIRLRIEEIEDRQTQKTDKLSELAELLKERQNQGMLGPVGGAAKGTGKWVKYFFLGMGSEESIMNKEAAKVSKASGNEAFLISELKDSIELDNIMIEARGREIEKLDKNLDLLKKKGKSMNNFRFRSVLVERPSNVLGETIDFASKIIPRKDKKTALINQLDKETQKLSFLEQEWAGINSRLAAFALEGKSSGSEVYSSQSQSDLAVAVTETISSKQAPAVIQESAFSDEKKVEYERLSQEVKGVKSLIINKNKNILKLKQRLQLEIQNSLQANNISFSELKDLKRDKKAEKEKSNVTKELIGIDKDINKFIEEEKELLEKQESVFRKKLEELDRSIQSLRKSADDRYELLLSEKQVVQGRLNEVIQLISNLSSEQATVAR